MNIIFLPFEANLKLCQIEILLSFCQKWRKYLFGNYLKTSHDITIAFTDKMGFRKILQLEFVLTLLFSLLLEVFYLVLSVKMLIKN